MYRASVTIKGSAPYAQSKQHRIERNDGESYEELEERTWREKCSYDANEIVFVPAMALKQALDLAAKRLAIPDPDNRRAALTKFFVSDVICEANLSLGVHKNDMPNIRFNGSSTGKRGSGGGTRVIRIMPQLQEWGGTTSFLVMEEKIKPAIFERVLAAAGQSIGVGQFRPENGGLNGRFEIVDMKIQKLD